MKNIIFALFLAVGASQVYATEAPKKETRKVCVDVKDKEGKTVKNKDGSVKQNCREVKVHKKLDDATKVPGK